MLREELQALAPSSSERELVWVAETLLRNGFSRACHLIGALADDMCGIDGVAAPVGAQKTSITRFVRLASEKGDLRCGARGFPSGAPSALPLLAGEQPPRAVRRNRSRSAARAVGGPRTLRSGRRTVVWLARCRPGRRPSSSARAQPVVWRRAPLPHRRLPTAARRRGCTSPASRRRPTCRFIRVAVLSRRAGLSHRCQQVGGQRKSGRPDGLVPTLTGLREVRGLRLVRFRQADFG